MEQIGEKLYKHVKRKADVLYAGDTHLKGCSMWECGSDVGERL